MRKKSTGIPKHMEQGVEEVVVSTDNRSLRKGRRVAPRTEVCRPVLLWLPADPEEKYQGVVLDLNPHGLRIRSLESFPLGSSLHIQMMRDDEFAVPLSPPIHVQVTRLSSHDGFYDLGVRVIQPKIRKPDEMKPIAIVRSRRLTRPTTRMHTLDIQIDERGIRRAGRNRG